MFIATLSGVTSNLPPACPTDITISGLCLTIFSSIFSNDFLKTVGISNFITSAPAIVSGSCLTASNAGFTDSPPNGSNPVIKTFIFISPLVNTTDSGIIYQNLLYIYLINYNSFFILEP